MVEGIEHTVLCRDADGVEFSGTLSLEEVRPASPDGKYPAVMQPVVRSTHPAPATDKLNIVLAAVDFSDDRAGWIGEEELRMNLRRFSADEAVKIWTVLTIFPGRYAPLQTALQASGSTLSPEKQGRNSGDRTRC